MLGFFRFDDSGVLNSFSDWNWCVCGFESNNSSCSVIPHRRIWQEDAHIGHEVENEGCVAQAERFIDEAWNAVREVNLTFFSPDNHVTSVNLDLHRPALVLYSVSVGQRTSIEIIDLGNWSKRHKSNDHVHWTVNWAQINNAGNFSHQTGQRLH